MTGTAPRGETDPTGMGSIDRGDATGTGAGRATGSGRERGEDAPDLRSSLGGGEGACARGELTRGSADDDDVDVDDDEVAIAPRDANGATLASS